MYLTFDAVATAANAWGYAEHSFNNCLTLDAVAISAVGCGFDEPHVLMLYRLLMLFLLQQLTVDMQNIQNIRLITVLLLMLCVC